MSKIFITINIIALGFFGASSSFANGHIQDFSESGFFILNTLLFLISGF